jgi:broad specificity phosphatase PhoE
MRQEDLQFLVTYNQGECRFFGSIKDASKFASEVEGTVWDVENIQTRFLDTFNPVVKKLRETKVFNSVTKTGGEITALELLEEFDLISSEGEFTKLSLQEKQQVIFEAIEEWLHPDEDAEQIRILIGAFNSLGAETWDEYNARLEQEIKEEHETEVHAEMKRLAECEVRRIECGY